MPLAIDIFCGLGGWTDGLLAEGYDVVGFDIERHVYGEERYPGQLVIQDARTINGAQFRDAALIVASPPCQEYSYMGMPWTRAKQIREALNGRAEFPAKYKGSRTILELNALFITCYRIQRQAIAANGGRFIPLVIENVNKAQEWVGRANWKYGSYYLWGNVPAVMPFAHSATKVPGISWHHPSDPRFEVGAGFNTHADRQTKLVHQRDGHAHTRRLTHQADHEAVKQPGLAGMRENGKGDRWFQDGAASHGSKSPARKAASARIAKIPLQLARHIGHVYHPARVHG